jgi:O-antigen/teichoic acid export membrane protein
METNEIPGGALRLTFANAIQYVVLALFYMIVTKTNALTQTDIGTLSILSFLASTFSLLTVIALPTALVKFTSEKLGKNQKGEAAATQRTITKIVITLSIIGLVIAIILSQLLSQYFWNNTEFTVIIILNFAYAFLYNLIGLCRSTLHALYLFGKMAAITIIYIISSRVISITLALLNIGVTGVIIGYIVGLITALTLAVIFLKGKLHKTTKNAPIKPILRFSFPLFLGATTELILKWADIVIITSLTRNLSLTGIYGIVVNSVGTLTILYMPMITTIFPALSAHHGLQKPENISKILKTTSRYIIYILFPSCIGLGIIAPTALTFFYGSNYAKGSVPLAILSITTIIMAFVLLLETTLTAIGKTGQQLRIKIISAISSILALIVFIPPFEITGAALARLTTQIIAVTIAVYIIGKELKIRLDKEAFWKSALATMVTIPILLTLEYVISTKLTTTQILITELLTAAAIYLFALYILRAMKKQDFDLLRQAFPTPLTKYINIIERLIVR